MSTCTYSDGHDMQPQFKLPILLCGTLLLFSNSAMSEGFIEGVYSGYMGRSQVSEVIKLLANAKYPIAKYFQNHNGVRPCDYVEGCLQISMGSANGRVWPIGFSLPAEG